MIMSKEELADLHSQGYRKMAIVEDSEKLWVKVFNEEENLYSIENQPVTNRVNMSDIVVAEKDSDGLLIFKSIHRKANNKNFKCLCLKKHFSDSSFDGLRGILDLFSKRLKDKNEAHHLLFEFVLGNNILNHKYHSTFFITINMNHTDSFEFYNKLTEYFNSKSEHVKYHVE